MGLWDHGPSCVSLPSRSKVSPFAFPCASCHDGLPKAMEPITPSLCKPRRHLSHAATAIFILYLLLSAECAELAVMNFMVFLLLLLPLTVLVFKPHQSAATAVVVQDGDKVNVVNAQKESLADFIFKGDAVLSNTCGKRTPFPTPPHLSCSLSPGPSQKFWFPYSYPPPGSP